MGMLSIVLSTLPLCIALQSCHDAHSCSSDVLFVFLNGIVQLKEGADLVSRTALSVSVVRGVRELIDVFERDGCSAEFRRRCFPEDNDMDKRYAALALSNNSTQPISLIGNFSNASVISSRLAAIAGSFVVMPSPLYNNSTQRSRK